MKLFYSIAMIALLAFPAPSFGDGFGAWCCKEKYAKHVSTELYVPGTELYETVKGIYDGLRPHSDREKSYAPFTGVSSAGIDRLLLPWYVLATPFAAIYDVARAAYYPVDSLKAHFHAHKYGQTLELMAYLEEIEKEGRWSSHEAATRLEADTATELRDIDALKSYETLVSSEVFASFALKAKAVPNSYKDLVQVLLKEYLIGSSFCGSPKQKSAKFVTLDELAAMVQ
jgi:hypothetical protein